MSIPNRKLPPRKLPPRKRNANSASAKQKAKRFRNATAAVPAPRARPVDRERGALAEVMRLPELGHVGKVLVGAAAASAAGAYAVNKGFHPYIVSTVLAAGGAITAWRVDEGWVRDVMLGAASAAGSQLMLLGLNPAAADVSLASRGPAPSSNVQVAATPAPRTFAPVKPRAADLSGLPPGMLDAALERARAELAVADDGYPPGYDPHPQGHHPHEHDHHHVTPQ